MTEWVDIINPLKSRGVNTPDFNELRQYDHILVFNYIWKFRPDREYAPTLQPYTSAYLGKAYTVMDEYVVKETTGPVHDRQRVAFIQKDPAPVGQWSPLFKSHIKGELYALTPEAILNMDVILGNRVRYYRKKIFVKPIDQESKFKNGLVPPVQAFIYFGYDTFWANIAMQKGSNVRDGLTGKWMWQ